MKAIQSTDSVLQKDKDFQFDWLAVALGKIAEYHGTKGDLIQRAAGAMKVREGTIITWLERGLGELPFGRVCLISELSKIPVSLLAQRLGESPCPDAPKPRKPAKPRGRARPASRPSARRSARPAKS